MAMSHVLSGLLAKRAELVAERAGLCGELAALDAALHHLDAVIALFDPASTPDKLPRCRARGRGAWFVPGELARFVLDTLRETEAPLTARELTERALASKGLPAGDARALQLIGKSVDSYLRAQRGRLLECVGDVRSVGWLVRELVQGQRISPSNGFLDHAFTSSAGASAHLRCPLSTDILP
jgi:hypothetical protein